MPPYTFGTVRHFREKPCRMLMLSYIIEVIMGVQDSVVDKLANSADKLSDTQIAETLTLLIEHGVKHSASGIHIEPHDKHVLVRYRIGNTLRGAHNLPRPALPKLMQQLKMRTDLDPIEAHSPQEGRYTVTVGEQTIDVDASIMPVLGGEKAVLHLQPQLDKPPELEGLGFWGENLEHIRNHLARPHGLILAAGPKRSGISTTLHSLLHLLSTPVVSIATVESRTKHRIPGATHLHVDTRKGDTVHSKLQAALRHDPNIVLVDDTSDKNTTELTVQAALQGHMLLAGTHAPDSIHGLLRMRNLGVEPFLLASTLRLGIGQHMVRRLCMHCRERYKVDDHEHGRLAKTFGLSTAAKQQRLHELEQTARAAGLGDDERPSTDARRITHLWRAKKGGCDKCDRSGYHGHIAIVEVLQNSDALQKHLAAPEAPTIKELHNTALQNGFIPSALDGLIKSLRGETTVEEVLRVAEP